MSILEAVHFADLMGLKTRAGKKLVNSSIYYILDNPFYYGEMKTKRGIIKHVYPTLISPRALGAMPKAEGPEQS